MRLLRPRHTCPLLPLPGFEKAGKDHSIPFSSPGWEVLGGSSYQPPAAVYSTGSFPRVSITGNFLWGSPRCINKEFLGPLQKWPRQSRQSTWEVAGDRGHRSYHTVSLPWNYQKSAYPWAYVGFYLLASSFYQTELGEGNSTIATNFAGCPLPLTSEFVPLLYLDD